MNGQPLRKAGMAFVALFALLAIIALGSAIGVAASDPPPGESAESTQDAGAAEGHDDGEDAWTEDGSDRDSSDEEYVSDGEYELAVEVDGSYCGWAPDAACADPGQAIAAGNENPVLFTVLVTWNGEPAPGLTPDVLVFDVGSAPVAGAALDVCSPEDDGWCPAAEERFVDHGNGLYSIIAAPSPDGDGWVSGTYSVAIALDDCGLVAGALATVTVP